MEGAVGQTLPVRSTVALEISPLPPHTGAEHWSAPVGPVAHGFTLDVIPRPARRPSPFRKLNGRSTNNFAARRLTSGDELKLKSPDWFLLARLLSALPAHT